MVILRPESSRLYFRRAHRIHAEPSVQLPADRVANVESVQQVLRLCGTRSCYVQQKQVVVQHLRHGDQALLQRMRTGHRDVADFRHVQ